MSVFINMINERWFMPIICFAVATTVFSQVLPVSFIMRPAMLLLWVALLTLVILKNGKNIKFSKFNKVFVCLYVALFIFCLVLHLLGYEHLKSSFLRIIRIPLFMSLLGDLLRVRLTRKDLNIISRVYIICSLVFAIWVHVNYFPSYSGWLTSMRYAYASKNSAVQVWAAAIFLIFCFQKYHSPSERIFAYIVGVYFVFISMMVQGRAAVLGMIFAYGCFLLFRLEKSRKIRWIMVSALVALLLVLMPPTRNFITHSFFLDKYLGINTVEQTVGSETVGSDEQTKEEIDILDGETLNKLSSNRWFKYKKVWDLFMSSPVFGIGNKYLDFMYLALLAELGIIGSLIVLPMWGYRGFRNIFFKGNHLLLFMTCFYFVESMLEGYPPFGPGASCFMFWLFSSLLADGEKRGCSQKIEQAAS